MHDLLVLLVKGAFGGALVVAFALLSEIVRPKSFAGLFGAAPSIALAALIVTVTTKTADAGRVQSIAMLGGAVALIVYCISATVAVDRWGALRGSAVAIGGWFAAAALCYVAIFVR